MQDVNNENAELLRVHYAREEVYEPEPVTFCTQGTQTAYRESSTQYDVQDLHKDTRRHLRTVLVPLQLRPACCRVVLTLTQEHVQIPQLRHTAQSHVVQSRTTQRRVAEHQRAKAKFQATLGDTHSAQEFAARCLPCCLPTCLCLTACCMAAVAASGDLTTACNLIMQ